VPHSGVFMTSRLRCGARFLPSGGRPESPDSAARRIGTLKHRMTVASENTRSGEFIRLLLGCSVVACCMLTNGCSGVAPEREPSFTEARQYVTGLPPVALGLECTDTGRGGCQSGLCLKVKPGPTGRAVCTKACNTDGRDRCPSSWSCLQVRPNAQGWFCVPPTTWQARSVAPEPPLPPRNLGTARRLDGGAP
jgi:hypothetical protein